MVTAPRLALIEPHACREGGHHHRTLVAIARAAPPTLVVALGGIVPNTATGLLAAGAWVTTAPAGPAAHVLHPASQAAAALADTLLRRARTRRWPPSARRISHQVTLLARCLAEAAAVRTARRLAGPDVVIVILTASEALHGLAGLLGGPHVRFVHEIVTTEGALVRWTGRIATRGTRNVTVLVPTEAVGAAMRTRFPRLPCQVRPFAVGSPDDRLSEAEREDARQQFGIPHGQFAVCLVGGWWRYKDIDVIDAALRLADIPMTLLVAGTPTDEGTLRRWQDIQGIQVHALGGPVAEGELRRVYAAASATLVARRRGVGKESGLVADAARLGVPLLVSDHDPVLTARLASAEWARMFPAESATGLAQVLREAAERPLPRPGQTAAALVGVQAAAEQAAFLIRSRPAAKARK
jgi:glycosyltransferase involved in cell wall biosynthesis